MPDQPGPEPQLNPADPELEAAARAERERVALHDREIERDLSRRTRRSFLVGGATALGALGAWDWIRTRRWDSHTPWPLRGALGVNEEIARDYFRTRRLAPQFPISEAVKNVRINERIGMEDVLDPDDWSLQVEGADVDSDEDVLTLSMADIRKFPHAEHVTLLKCIEGWSQKVHWGGARFADFAKKYPPPQGYPYVGLETPDGGYYVGLDLESALQPQTLLCYEMNGEPLPEPHGAPLRLVIPTKYGIKNLKRIGKIFTRKSGPRITGRSWDTIGTRVYSPANPMSSPLPLSKPAQFVWYELHTADRNAAESFYKDVLGWRVQDSGQSERRYSLVSAGDVPIGGILEKPAHTLPTGKSAWTAYIGVDNVDNFSDQVKKAGGMMHREADDIPGVGQFAVAADPQGAVFVLFQPENDMQHAPAPDAGSPGSPAWHDLITTDWEAAFAFYAELFGWTKSDAIDMGPSGTYQIFAAGPKPIGGMVNRRNLNEPPHWMFYFHVEEIGATIERVKRAGGTVVHGPSVVPGGQQIAHCLDTHGGSFGMLRQAFSG